MVLTGFEGDVLVKIDVTDLMVVHRSTSHSDCEQKIQNRCFAISGSQMLIRGDVEINHPGLILEQTNFPNITILSENPIHRVHGLTLEQTNLHSITIVSENYVHSIHYHEFKRLASLYRKGYRMNYFYVYTLIPVRKQADFSCKRHQEHYMVQY